MRIWPICLTLYLGDGSITTTRRNLLFREGTWILRGTTSSAEFSLRKPGPEPLEDEFTPAVLKDVSERRKSF